jgi:hypothetical protein
LTNLLARVSLIAAVVLLVGNQFVSADVHGWLSALPLLLGGSAFALLQFRLRPPRVTLMKRLLLAAAFIGWGVNQLLPAGRVALFLGDAVIAAYVLDLFWMSGDQERERLHATSNFRD